MTPPINKPGCCVAGGRVENAKFSNLTVENKGASAKGWTGFTEKEPAERGAEENEAGGSIAVKEVGAEGRLFTALLVDPDC